MRIKSLIAAALFWSQSAFATVTVQDEHGTLSLEKTPERVVALEFSFVDALANIGVSPVGVADDNDKKRVPEEVRNLIQDWTSVGTRAQPNLESIALLKPDLIIADKDRHSTAYDELSKIAPVLLLNSRYGTFEQSLQQAQTIADVMNKSDEMKNKIKDLEDFIAQTKSALPMGQVAFLGGSREDGFSVHAQESYTGALLKALGFIVPNAPQGSKSIYEASLEQVAAINPNWIFVANYRDESIIKKWANEPLWQALTAVQKNQVVPVDTNLWSRSRGITAARMMVEEIKKTVLK